MAIFGDDPTSDYVDGPQDGEEIIWLIESQGQVYEAEVNWNTTQGFSDCNSFPGANGLCQGEISVGPFFINEFSQDNLSIGEHTIEILDGEIVKYSLTNHSPTTHSQLKTLIQVLRM